MGAPVEGVLRSIAQWRILMLFVGVPSIAGITTWLIDTGRDALYAVEQVEMAIDASPVVDSIRSRIDRIEEQQHVQRQIQSEMSDSIRAMSERQQRILDGIEIIMSPEQVREMERRQRTRDRFERRSVPGSRQ